MGQTFARPVLDSPSSQRSSNDSPLLSFQSLDAGSGAMIVAGLPSVPSPTPEMFQDLGGSEVEEDPSGLNQSTTTSKNDEKSAVDAVTTLDQCEVGSSKSESTKDGKVAELSFDSAIAKTIEAKQSVEANGNATEDEEEPIEYVVVPSDVEMPSLELNTIEILETLQKEEPEPSGEEKL